ncbi:SIMPL domain-containing protein [Variovorax sp. HJSM1_2]|uniref:SIMPL domain-containing protein n=1 Tax=Variovorax sp. HJSM1_2 TaxID=3366263 RepID=UPI003BD16EF1
MRTNRPHTLKLLTACIALAASGAAVAQNSVAQPTPQNVVQLSANGTVEVQQDLLSISLATTRDGADANSVQTQLKQALDAALSEVKSTAQPGQMDVRTGNFNLSPRYNKDGKLTGWQGSVGLVLEGRDFTRITAAAGRVQTMTLSNVDFGLSREKRAQVETEAQTQAIDSFKAKAGEIARGFGFSGYTLREVSVNANDQGFQPRVRAMAMEAKASYAASAPVPVEAGKTLVQVNVSGAVQLK